MANQISKILNEPKSREILIKNGLERINLFDWEKVAKETLEIYLILTML